MKYTETTYTNKIEILKYPDHYVAVPVMVDDDGVLVNTEGKKLVPAGTIVGGKTKPVLSNLDEPVSKKNTQGTDANAAEGVLLNDVEVTFGKTAGAMLIHGFIAIDKLPEAPAVDAISVLKGVHFIK